MFQSSRDGGGLFWKAADGTGQVERLKDGLGRPYAWAADGRLIFEEENDIGALTMEGERTVEMLLDEEFNEAEPSLSSDGRWLAYASTEIEVALIFVKSFLAIDDDPWRVSPNYGRHPVWSPSGRELFYRGVDQTDLMVSQIEIEPTFRRRTPEALFSLTGYLVVGGGGERQFDLAPDGDRFIFLKRGGDAQTSDGDPFNGLIFVENWFEELKERVPLP